MKEKIIYFLIFVSLTIMESCNSQTTDTPEKEISKYEFKNSKEISHTPIAYQDMTGTCWAFATTSFLESEITRKTGENVDLSEMHIVRNTYLQKAYSNVMRHGQFPFFEGCLNPDALETVKLFGLVPYENYTGLKDNDKYHNHQKVLKKIKDLLPEYAKKGIDKNDLQNEVNDLLDKAMEKEPTNFSYKSKLYTPESFLKYTGINPDEYLNVTSFSHKPFFKNMVLDVEWNIGSASFYNVPISDFLTIANNALDSGYTIAIELDVSEKTYSGDYGIAVVPENRADEITILFKPLPEKNITQEYRQQEFENFNTNNDHNQHIIGKITDQNGKNYFIAKNSWRDWGRNGYIYISEAYFKLKVLYYTLHKDALLNKYKFDCP